MFTGIIEEVGQVTEVRHEDTNVYFSLSASFFKELKVDQSIAHNGVCLTVTNLLSNGYEVCAVQETLGRTDLQTWRSGTTVNLERAMKLGDRLDGHLVQGHVDMIAKCKGIKEEGGSWTFSFEHSVGPGAVTVEKGSICVNGVSLTVVESEQSGFSVAVIPYTFANTNFRDLQVGDEVNLEFDIIGKYVARIMPQH